jgi:putative ABC transport system permease protein
MTNSACSTSGRIAASGRLKRRSAARTRLRWTIYGLQSGDEILVKTTDGRKFHLRVTGSVHDLYRIPPVIEGWLYGYISMDTVRWMGLPEGYNELYIDVSGNSETEIRDMTDEVADRIEGRGPAGLPEDAAGINEHPLNYIIQTILLLLGLLAVLSMFLSGFLVINVISALLAQQERQIGIMKAIGARSQQIIGLYFGMVCPSD